MEEAEALSDRVAIMGSGRLLLCDTAENIKRRAGKEKFEEAFVAIVKGAGK
jgi:ABC-2 type transport system ATP-binding protein